MSDWDDFLEAVRVLGFWKTLYLRILYRHHMKLIHHFGRCWFKRIYPQGQPQKWCTWCGERHIIYPAIDIEKAMSLMKSQPPTSGGKGL